jgi:hypothetical protein
MDALYKKIERQDDQAYYDYISPYGIGDSSEQIVNIIKMIKDEPMVMIKRIL